MLTYLKNLKLPFKVYVLVSFLVSSTVILSVFILRINNLPPEVPLFYGKAQTEEQIAPSLFLVLPSFISIAILILNTSLSFLIKNDFLKKTIIVSGIFSSVFSVITTLKIIILVGSF